jgi:pilus assembly protein CpaB
MKIASFIVLGVAVTLGAVAVGGVNFLLTRTGAQTKNEAPALTVVVARQPLEFGTELQPDLLREIPWGAQELPEGSFSKIKEIIGGERRVALRSIAPGELLLKDRISGFGGRATLSQIIAPGMRAVSLRINDVSGTGGFVLPGDRVDVLSTIQPSDDRIDTVSDILLRNVRVLAIDQTADDSQQGAVVAKAATLEVSSVDAQKIALASTIGSLSLSLRDMAASDEDKLTSLEMPTRTIRYNDLGPKRPVAPAPVVRAGKPAPAPPQTPTMRVTRGATSSVVQVQTDS